MLAKPQGTLIIIGGHEDKEGPGTILSEVARRTGKDGRIVIVTAATNLPQEVADDYRAVFTELGVQAIDVLDIRTRAEANDPANVQKLTGAEVLFFTGGDQLRITSQLGGSEVFRCMQEVYERGSVIVGTSAGAAAMPETMLVRGRGDESHRISALSMAPGLGFMPDVVIDSHFAERGRMGRLLGAVVQNPCHLGLGIDENTAVIVNDGHFEVMGEGAVYVVDGTGISYSSLSEQHSEGVVSIDDVKLHVLSEGDHFDLQTRRPVRTEAAPPRA